MQTSERAPKQFVDDFELVADHYKLKDSDEYKLAKSIAKADMKSAIPCYASLANEIRTS